MSSAWSPSRPINHYFLPPKPYPTAVLSGRRVSLRTEQIKKWQGYLAPKPRHSSFRPAVVKWVSGDDAPAPTRVSCGIHVSRSGWFPVPGMPSDPPPWANTERRTTKASRLTLPPRPGRDAQRPHRRRHVPRALRDRPVDTHSFSFMCVHWLGFHVSITC